MSTEEHGCATMVVSEQTDLLIYTDNDHDGVKPSTHARPRATRACSAEPRTKYLSLRNHIYYFQAAHPTQCDCLRLKLSLFVADMAHLFCNCNSNTRPLGHL